MNKLNPILLAAFQFEDAISLACTKLLAHPNATALDKEFCEMLACDLLGPGDTILGGHVVGCEENTFISVQDVIFRTDVGAICRFITVLWDNKIPFIAVEHEVGDPEVVYCEEGNEWKNDFIRLYSMFYG